MVYVKESKALTSLFSFDNHCIDFLKRCLFLLFPHECFHLYVLGVSHVCLVPIWARRRCQIPSNCSCDLSCQYWELNELSALNSYL